jgi:hypothetical protein
MTYFNTTTTAATTTAITTIAVATLSVSVTLRALSQKTQCQGKQCKKKKNYFLYSLMNYAKQQQKQRSYWHELKNYSNRVKTL